ncbi:ATP-dependent helicase [Crenobacter sp. SG2305]|uniref:ATP-dependent helicase n=1 Tax=Crenobacter oryzisoli TaxID=3056844 RepID=UPI0025AA5C17|nr:ATP-dependent helicase [Crenobacter sp. SG2305]MDN0082454.1 ATP-dependent helicase [Crenobacter sp. SG2305]
MSCETIEQLAVIHHEQGHALVGAVAGSGKTRTLIARITHRLKRGQDPRRMLVLMFNRSARDDFEKRLKPACRGIMATPPRVRTFHAFGLDLCKALQDRGLIPPAKLIEKDWELRRIARDVLEQVNLQLDEEDRFDTSNNETLADFLAMVDSIKNTLLLRDDEGFKSLAQKWRYGFTAFEERRLNGVEKFRTFTDLIYDPVMATFEHPDIAAFVANKYDEILVDEFQDVCELQVQLLVSVAGTRAQVVAVGDEDQTIYAFRNARPDYMIHQFEQLFPNTTRYTLSATFRYGHAVALLANHSIRHNTERTDKLCISAAAHQTDLSILLVRDDIGSQVLKALQDWTASGRALSECAILVREYSHAIMAETALVRNDIPYRLVGAPPFFERREVMAMRAAVLTATDSWHLVDTPERKRALLEALLTVPPLFLKRGDQEMLINMAMAEDDPAEALRDAIGNMRSNAKGYAVKRYKLFCDHIDYCRKAGPSFPAARFLDNVVDKLDLPTVFARDASSSAVAREKVHLLTAFIELAKQHQGSLADFREFLEALAVKVGRGSEDDSVLITSIHRSKGLEYPHVVLPELSDERFPADPDQIEDERRLFYVAVTRAIERLTLLAPLDPQLMEWYGKAHYGHPDPSNIKASRFLYEANGRLARDAATAVLAGEAIGTPEQVGLDPQGQQAAYLKRYAEGLQALSNLTPNTPPEPAGPAALSLV